MAMASITRCGSPSSTLRSMNAPGSPSSALHTTYLTGSFCPAAKPPFIPVGKPAPPPPRLAPLQVLFVDLLRGLGIDAAVHHVDRIVCVVNFHQRLAVAHPDAA